MDYHTYTLPNGLRIIFTTSPTQVAYCGFSIDSGTRDEKDDKQGMAHFVEHLIFKGTKKRKAWHILNRMENVGGDLNAYTNKEETVVYSTFLVEYFDRALDLLTDIVFNSTFPQKEINKEVEVIIDEIKSYEDSPSDLIFDDFEDMVFHGHPLGRNILGKPEFLRKFNSDDGLNFVREFYQPANMVLFVFANMDFKKVIRTAEKYLEEIPNKAVKNKRTPLPLYKPQSLIIHKDTHQAHVMIGTRGYNAYDEKRTGLYLLNNLLGGPGMNSRLNVSLRERRGLVYNVESNLTSYTDTGVFSIYFGSDQEDMDYCLDLVLEELKKLRDSRLNTTQLTAAKKQLIGQICVASDNFENYALDMGKAFLHYNHCDSQEDVIRRIEALTSGQLLEITNELFYEKGLSTLIYK